MCTIRYPRYPCSENNCADQLRGYCEADLRLCFRRRRLLVFTEAAQISNVCLFGSLVKASIIKYGHVGTLPPLYWSSSQYWDEITF